MKEEEIKKLLHNDKLKGDAWVEKALAAVVDIARTVTEAEGLKAEESDIPKKMLKEIADKYAPLLSTLYTLDSGLRKRILLEHDGADPVKVEDVGELIFPQRWGFEVVDLSKVDRKFLTIDSTAVNEEIKNGVRKIKGLEILQKRSLQVRPAKEK